MPKQPGADVRAEIEQAEAAERARRHDIAREHYEKAVAAAKDPASIWLARREYAETLATWGEYPAAIEHLEAALVAKPSDASAWHDLGVMRFHESDKTGAIEALEKSIALAPKDFRPRRTLAVLYWKSGDLGRADALYHDMLVLDLPDRVRTAVKWAITAIAAIQRGEPPPPPPNPESRPR